MSTSNPKYDWLLTQVISGSTIAIGDEDKPLWDSLAGKFGVGMARDIQSAPQTKVVIIGEQLELVDNPVELLKEARKKGDSVCITVSNQHSWDSKFKPFTNKKHKRYYDIELLCQHLEEANLRYAIEMLDFGGWSFWVVTAKGI